MPVFIGKNQKNSNYQKIFCFIENPDMKDKVWTTEDIPRLSEKVIIVTGGSSGTGLKSVYTFAKKGAQVILATHSLEKGQEACKKLLQKIPGGKIDVLKLNLTDLESIEKFSAQVLQRYSRLDVLLNSAGVLTPPDLYGPNGIEGHLGINHFGHFALTGKLLILMSQTPGSRVVNVSRTGAREGKMPFENLLFDNGKETTPEKADARSELVNFLFTHELQQFFEKNNIQSIAVAAHPGQPITNFTRSNRNSWFSATTNSWFPFSSSEDYGEVLPLIRASVDPGVKGGEHYGLSELTEMNGYPVKLKTKGIPFNGEDSRNLWKLSEQLTGVSFTPESE